VTQESIIRRKFLPAKDSQLLYDILVRPLISSGMTISVNMHTRTWSGEVGFNEKQPARSCRPCAGECDRSWSHLDDRLQTVLHHLKRQHHGAWALDTERRKHPRFKAENPQIWAGRWLSPTEFETSASFVDNISLGGARVETTSTPIVGQEIWIRPAQSTEPRSLRAKVLDFRMIDQGSYSVRLAFDEQFSESLVSCLLQGTIPPGERESDVIDC